MKKDRGPDAFKPGQAVVGFTEEMLITGHLVSWSAAEQDWTFRDGGGLTWFVRWIADANSYKEDEEFVNQASEGLLHRRRRLLEHLNKIENNLAQLGFVV